MSYPSLAHRAVRARLDGESLAEEMRLLYVALTRAKEKLILVSTARDLEARAAQAAEAARHRGWRLPASTVLKARSWLISLPAIARHRDGQPLRAQGAGDLGEAFYAPADPEVFEAQARWSVHLWTQDTVDTIDIAPRVILTTSLWEAMARRTPVTMEVDPQLREKLDQIVAADYPHAGLLETPAKVSVTETARRFEAGEDEVEELLYRRPSLLRPSLGARRQPLSAAERGTAVHTFLARLDFGDVSLGGLRAQAERLCQRGILSQAELEAIDFSSLARFFATPLGERIVRASQDNGAASRFWRELAFTMRLPARAFWDQEIRDPGEPGHDVVVVQGAIDCLVREDDRFLLIDYKTDRVEPGREAEAARGTTGKCGFTASLCPGAHPEPTSSRTSCFWKPARQLKWSEGRWGKQSRATRQSLIGGVFRSLRVPGKEPGPVSAGGADWPHAVDVDLGERAHGHGKDPHCRLSCRKDPGKRKARDLHGPDQGLDRGKIREFASLFGTDRVGIVTGDVTVQPGACVVVMTTEILRNMLLRGNAAFDDVDWVVFDEIHYIGHAERGAVWEQALLLLPQHVRVLGLSATIPNASELAAWLEKARGEPIHLVTSHERAVPLEHYYFNRECKAVSRDAWVAAYLQSYHWEEDEIDPKGGHWEEEDWRQSFRELGGRHRIRDDSSHLDVIEYVAQERLFPCLYFDFSRRGAAAKAEALAKRSRACQKRSARASGRR